MVRANLRQNIILPKGNGRKLTKTVFFAKKNLNVQLLGFEDLYLRLQLFRSHTYYYARID